MVSRELSDGMDQKKFRFGRGKIFTAQREIKAPVMIGNKTYRLGWYKIIPINGKIDKQAHQGPTISETLDCRGERSKAFTTEPMAARQGRWPRKS